MVYEIINPSFNIEIEGYVYLGRGPHSVKGTFGWSTGNKIYYRCACCGSLMQSTINDDFRCECGAMSLDKDFGRFGSRYGDNNILVYMKKL